MPRFRVRTTEKFHRVAVRRKPKGKRRWGMLHFGDGIMAARFMERGKWYTQTVLFPKDKFSAAEALAWVREKAKEQAAVVAIAKKATVKNPPKWGWK